MRNQRILRWHPLWDKFKCWCCFKMIYLIQAGLCIVCHGANIVLALGTQTSFPKKLCTKSRPILWEKKKSSPWPLDSLPPHGWTHLDPAAKSIDSGDSHPSSGAVTPSRRIESRGPWTSSRPRGPKNPSIFHIWKKNHKATVWLGTERCFTFFHL